MPKDNRTKEPKQTVTERARQVVERAVTENPGMLGRAARSLRDRQSQIDDYVEGRRSK